MSNTPNNNVQTLCTLIAITLVIILGTFGVAHKVKQAANHAAALQTDLTTCRIEVAGKDKELAAKDEEILAVTMLAGRLRMQLWEMQPEPHKGNLGVLNENPPLDP